MKLSGFGACFEDWEAVDTRETEKTEPIEASVEALEMEQDNDVPLLDELPKGMEQMLDSDAPAAFVNELDSRKRNDIEMDLHEARAKVDFHSRRQAALAASGDTATLSYGQHERAARGWGYRMAKLEDELKKCED